jgi:hypothetical protein
MKTEEFNLCEKYKNIFELMEVLQSSEYLDKKTDILKYIDLTLSLTSNMRDAFKVMNVSFSALEMMANFKFKSINNKQCNISANLYDWLVFIKNAIANWYDSHLVAMMILAIIDFVNTEYLNYSQAKQNYNVPKDFFGLEDDVYEKIIACAEKMEKAVGIVSKDDYKLLVTEFDISEFNSSDFEKISATLNKANNKTFFNSYTSKFGILQKIYK